MFKIKGPSGCKAGGEKMPKYIQVTREKDYSNTSLDEEHENYIKTVIKEKDTLINVLENDKALSNMLYDMIKNIVATAP